MSTTGQISTRPGTEADGDDLWRILTEALASGRSRALDATAPREQAIEQWTRDERVGFVAERDGRLIGTCTIHPYRSRLDAPVATAALVVDPADHGLYVHHELLRRAVDVAAGAGSEGVRLEVIVTNVAVVQIYRALGFVIVGREPAACRLPDGSRADVLVLHRFLAPTHSGPDADRAAAS
ncbi:MAG: GNAT family N-acetyltransferase [Nocardioides sp.]